MEEEDEIKKVVEQLDKFKLIDIISSVYYYYMAVGEYDKMITTVEQEYMINLIYKTGSKGNKIPNKSDVMLIIELANSIIIKKQMQSIKESQKQSENIAFTQARDNFIYIKEDKEYNSMVFEYLNLFNPMEKFFTEYYSFKIENFLYFTKLIQVEYVNRMKLISSVLKDFTDNVTREVLIDYLLNCNCSILNFNETTLVKDKENIIAFTNILKKFSVDKYQCKQANYDNCPIFKKENTYIFSSIVTLLNKAKSVFESEIHKDKCISNEYSKLKGEYLEILTEDVIKGILKDASVFSNIQYRENKHNRECDLLVIYDQIILIIEIKSRAFKEVSKEGLKNYLRQDLEDNIYKAYNQATRMEEYLRNNNNVSLRYGKEKGELKIQNTDKFHIFKIGITLENFREYAVQYTEFDKDIGHDMLFLNINDLKFISNYFRYQTEFTHYISQRIKTNKYINKFYMYDELYLFSEYKINNLQSILNNDHQVKIYDRTRYQLFDLRFDTQKKEQILMGNIHPIIDEAIKQIESEKLPTYSLTIMDLLDLDYKTQEYIFEQLKTARLKYRKTGKVTHVCMTIDEERDSKGIYIVLGVSDKKEENDSLQGIIILGSILKRKYPNCEVIGMQNNIEEKEEKIVQCLKIMEPKPDFDKELEKIEELKNWDIK